MKWRQWSATKAVVTATYASNGDARLQRRWLLGRALFSNGVWEAGEVIEFAVDWEVSLFVQRGYI
ncbi:uncharacterized protein G2W53_022188 [Senna tora]|uniref:Uncharacterized protein n=1 Tax=Senna tora TaxID=362788 RepID=A0A834WNY9_9FABA|nr:uncharacterized protein G2W53_022188 [Senna tora]